MRHLAVIPIPSYQAENLLRPQRGKPQITYSIEAALSSTMFDEIMVFSDHPEIRALAAYHRISLPDLKWAKELSEVSDVSEILLHVLNLYQSRGVRFRYACCVYPYTEKINKEKLQEAYSKLRRGKLDSVLPITPVDFTIGKALLLQHGKVKDLKSELGVSDLPTTEKVYLDYEQFCWFDTLKFKENRKLLTANSGAVLVSNEEKI